MWQKLGRIQAGLSAAQGEILQNTESSSPIYSLLTKTWHIFYVPQRMCLTFPSTNPEYKAVLFIRVFSSHHPCEQALVYKDS